MIFFFEYIVLNSMISLKYETNELSDCISMITGINLCEKIEKFHFFAFFSFLGLIILLFFRKRILGSHN